MRKIVFATDEFYHIYNRGTDKRDVFLHTRDYERFLYLLWACNDKNPVINTSFYYRGFASIDLKKKREQLVDIVCFCLMPNHYHLLLRQKTEGGISLFMQKLGTAYTMYFNTRCERTGVLFQGVFKAAHVDREEYFAHLTRYIHLNPAELREPKWKERGIRKLRETMEFIQAYKWSSCQDYLGSPKFVPILNKALIQELSLPPKEYEKYLREWTKEYAHFIVDYTLE